MRLKDEGATALERALLDAGTAYRGSPTARAKTLGALGLAGSVTLAGAATARGALSLGKLSLGKLSLGKLFAGAAIFGAVAAVPAGYRALHRQDPVARAPLAAAPAPAVEPPMAAAPTAVAAPAVPAPAEEIRAPRHARAEVAIPLARELASIDAARTALARGDASGALARLDGYARTFPRGRLDLEAEVLRIDALAESGRTDTARAHAREFLRRHPNSVLAAHVRTRLAD